MKLIDSGYLLKASYPFEGRERYDLSNGNCYLQKNQHSYYGIGQGAIVKIFDSENRLYADWGNGPTVEVIPAPKKG